MRPAGEMAMLWAAAGSRMCERTPTESVAGASEICKGYRDACRGRRPVGAGVDDGEQQIAQLSDGDGKGSSDHGDGTELLVVVPS
ncbi:hypothetical protein HPP92_004693 [Vanilla planifolia]|uniref:Uncharacterized protein n=1 Tax=Vanilla planifolia TaxID=51239 RepID=A0A835RN67_VANPL|nr:hypothetical protein HPP92_004693 [Vanilla planifolia]